MLRKTLKGWGAEIYFSHPFISFHCQLVVLYEQFSPMGESIKMENIDWMGMYNNLWHLLVAFALAFPQGLTGAIGLAVAFDRFEIAITLSLLNFMTLWILDRFKKVLPENKHNN